MEEQTCPICKKNVVSDATAKEFCTVCGMGIPEPLIAPKFKQKGKDLLFFCCQRCSSLYKSKIMTYKGRKK
jgi:YHS domain-containing protein